MSIYRSPNGDVGVFLEKFDHLLSFLSRPKWKNYDFVLGGDVNSDFDVNKSKRSGTELLNLLRQYNFKFVNSKPTRGLSCLDSIFTNLKLTNQSSEVLNFLYSDHDALTLNYCFSRPFVVDSNFKMFITRPLSADKVEYFRNSLFNINWLHLLKEPVIINKYTAKEVFKTFL